MREEIYKLHACNALHKTLSISQLIMPGLHLSQRENQTCGDNCVGACPLIQDRRDSAKSILHVYGSRVHYVVTQYSETAARSRHLCHL